MEIVQFFVLMYYSAVKPFINYSLIYPSTFPWISTKKSLKIIFKYVAK